MKRCMQRPLCLVAVFYVVFVFLMQIFTEPSQSGVASNLGKETALVGQLYKKEIKNDHLIFYLNHIQILNHTNIKKNSNQNSDYKEKLNKAVCYMTSDSYEKVPIGRWLYVRGESLPFEAAENDGQFDAASYYAGMGYAVRLWDTQMLENGNTYHFWAEQMVDIKSGIALRFCKYMQEENAGVLSAMLLGDKTSMSAEVKDLYRKSGIAHILAISGLHISLIGMMLYRLLRRIYLPQPLCCVLGIGIVLVYIKTSGIATSSFRAVCMFVLYMMADLLGRTYDLLTALAFSAILSLIENPQTLFEAGFLLSYVAVLGLALVLPVFKKLIPKEKEKSIICRMLPAYSVQILIFPITLWFYYEFPLYSFLLNLIVVPCMSVVLVSGMIGAIPGCGFVLYLTDFLLEGYEWLCRLTESLPGAVIVTGRPKVWQVVAYYVLVLVWLWKSGKKEGRKLLWAFVPLFCMLLFFLPVHLENRIDMLSVGQGDCVIMRDSCGKVVMVDGGSTDVSEVGTYRVVPFLKYHGISRIDVVFLSHAHTDHYSAIAELLESAGRDGVQIGTLCLTGYAERKMSSEGQVYEEITSLAQKAGCKVVYLNPGEHITCGKMEFDCVYPPSDISSADENDTSMIMLARLKDFSMLFTGDSTCACDEEVTRRLRMLGVDEIDCLKVAHHGAQTSTSKELLEAFDFKLALISCGKENSYGHPHAELLSRLEENGCKTFVTADLGQVTVRIYQGKAGVDVYRNDLWYNTY